MSAVRIAAIVLIVAGIVGLIYGKFGYTKETHEAKLGSLELSVKEKRNVNVPVWAGVGAIVVGGALLFVPRKKS
jgi:multidrug transporter EmrE-like cation transporter